MESFLLKPQIFYGNDSINYLNQLKGKRAFIVTDKSMVNLGFIKKVTEPLENAGIGYTVFSDVEADPSRKTVFNGLNSMIQQKPDVLIAIGGGSPIDAAKAIMFFCIKTKEKLIDKEYIKKPFFIAIPTTSGTGSEVTSYAVITDEISHEKIPLAENIMIPDMAILDYNLTRTLPPSITAQTGMDVLTHALESYVSRRASDYTDAYAEKAIELVFNYLLRAFECGDDLQARAKMHTASCMAGIAFSNSSLGINHSLAHSIGGIFKLPHGQSNALMLPYVLNFNAGVYSHNFQENEVSEKLGIIAMRLGFPCRNLKEAVLSISESVKLLNKKMNLPCTLKEAGVNKEIFLKNVDKMAQTAYGDICTDGNPVTVTINDLKYILMAAYGD